MLLDHETSLKLRERSQDVYMLHAAGVAREQLQRLWRRAEKESC